MSARRRVGGRKVGVEGTGASEVEGSIRVEARHLL